METAIVSAVLSSLAPTLYALARDRYSLEENVRRDVQSVKAELDMMLAAIQVHAASHGSGPVVQAVWVDKARRLAHQMEDCVDRFVYDQLTAAHGSSRHAAPLGSRPTSGAVRIHDISLTRALREESARLYELKTKYAGPMAATGPPSAAKKSSAMSEPVPALRRNLVGMEAPRRELLELVEEEEEEEEAEGGKKRRQKVISIVGFGGLGKTALAKQVYDDVGGGQFSPMVWVSAAEKTAEEVLEEILIKKFGSQVRDDDDDMADVEHLSLRLRTHLRNKR
ncbi:disease resistance protein RGA4-like [Oryza sativa Japonica Group]|uniref:Disease resistance protein n=2 Tax=Oryza sativa subsp. japonica TaxID=39947 RepID=Q7G3B7_ORYSJ|nr:putative disease resistance gene [Oryza sativa Japonica Group]AAP53358.1 hypothetical protein LOC_Os10g22290 [Oryza sativa Japonica Group]